MAELTPPIEHNPRHTVENVHELPVPPALQEGEPDYESRDGFVDFLHDRLRPDQQYIAGRQIGIEAEHVWEPTLLPRPTGEWSYWGTTKRRFWASVIGVNALVNVGMNAPRLIASAVKDGVEELQAGKDYIDDWREVGWQKVTCPPTTESTPVAPVPGEAHLTTFISPETVGSAKPNQGDVEHLADQLVQLKDAGNTLNQLTVTGSASDEWRTKPFTGLTQADAENTALADERQSAFMDAFNASLAARGQKLSDIVDIRFKEQVLSDAEVATIQNEVDRFGYGSIREALDVFNQTPDKLPADLKVTLDLYFGENRGVSVDVDYTEATTTPPPITSEKPCPPHKVDDGSPRNEKHDYGLDFFPFPLVPLPILRRRIIEKVKYDFFEIPGEMPEPEYLKLYPEAARQTGELVKEAWAYARKYQNLFREDERLTTSYRLNYVDEEGNDQYLRTMFVDHYPTLETLEMMRGMFQKFSQMQGGRMGRELDMVVVYPTQNAGLHGDAKKVGLGLDIQYEDGILGVAIPTVGLIEIQMPADPTPEDLKDTEYELATRVSETFDVFRPDGPDTPYSTKWTLGHEAGGHFTDLNDEKNRLYPIGYNRNGVLVFGATNRFANSAQADFDRQTAREAGADPRTWWQRVLRRPFSNNLTWHIKRGTRMVSGQIEDRDEVVKTTDARLTEAEFIRNNGFIDDYGRSNAAEHYAQAAAQVSTGIGVPLNEEPQIVLNRVRPRIGYADTYAASDTMHELLTQRWGSDPTDDHLRFTNEAAARANWSEWYGRVQDDYDLWEMAENAREHPLPTEEELLHIITGKRIER